MIRSFYASLTTLFILTLLGGCGDYSWRDILYKTAEPIDMRIAYVEGAAPFFDPVAGDNPWEIFAGNIRGLFPDKSFNLPKSSADLIYLEGTQPEAFTDEDIVVLGKKIPGSTSSLRILFVGGQHTNSVNSDYKINAKYFPKPNLIALFQGAYALPYVTGSQNAFVEQTKLLHEFGHAIGLVNNGVPMVQVHNYPADFPVAEPTTHCNNLTCVMSQGSSFNRWWNYLVWEKNRDNPDVMRMLFDKECQNDVLTHSMSARTY